MKKLSFLGFLIVIGVALFYLSQDSKKEAVPSLMKAATPSKNLFLGKRAALVTQASEQIDGCSELRNQLDSIDFTLPAKEWRAVLSLELLKTCSDPEIFERTKLIQETCFDKKDDDLCSTNAVFLRAYLRTKGLKNSDDKEQLADLVLREFAKGMPDFKNLKNLAEKLMNMDPKQLAYQKLWAMSKLIASVDSKKSPLDLADDIYGRVDPEMWEDPQMKGLDLALKTGFDPQEIESMTREALAQKDDSWTREALGWSLWKQGRKSEALDNLRRAIQLNPKDPWLQEQYKRVKSKGAGPDDYHGRISLGVSVEDLFD